MNENLFLRNYWALEKLFLLFRGIELEEFLLLFRGITGRWRNSSCYLMELLSVGALEEFLLLFRGIPDHWRNSSCYCFGITECSRNFSCYLRELLSEGWYSSCYWWGITERWRNSSCYLGELLSEGWYSSGYRWGIIEWRELFLMLLLGNYWEKGVILPANMEQFWCGVWYVPPPCGSGCIIDARTGGSHCINLTKLLLPALNFSIVGYPLKKFPR